MSIPPPIQRENMVAKVRAWLASDVRIIVPGWAVAAGAAAVLVLLLVALD